MRKTHNTRILLGIAFAALLMALVALATTFGVSRLLRGNAWVEHTHEVVGAIEHTYSIVKDAEAAQRGFLLSGQVEFEQEFFAAIPQAREAAAVVVYQVRDNREQSARATQLADLIEKRLQVLSAISQRFRDSGLDSARDLLKSSSGPELMRRIERLRSQMVDVEGNLLRERVARSKADAGWLRTYTNLGSALGLTLLALVAWRMLREIAQRERAELLAARANVGLTQSMAELRTHSAHARELSRYASMLQSCRNVEEAIEITRGAMAQLLPELGGSLYVLRASQDLAEQVGSWGTHAAVSAALLAPPDCWALRRGQTYEVEDVHTGTRCAHVELPPSDQPASCLCIPLTAHGETMGFLYFSGAGASAISSRELAVAAAEQLSLALSNLRLQDSLRVQSIRDPLTGLFNRRYLEESLTRELARCERRGLPLSVLMIDLDHFKRYNDTHGHDGGDALLTHAGRLLRAQCRVDDIACRYGGEEFVLILPEMDADGARQRAEHVCRAIEGLQVKHLLQALSPVTASIGVATFPLNATNAEELLRIADAALYRAKNEGRNRVVVA